MEKWKKRAVELIGGLLMNERSPSVVPYVPQKTRLLNKEKRYLTRSTPERHGISSARIHAMLCELEAEPRANVHSIIIVADSEVISECSAPGYSVNLPHLAHSMSKSITALAVGMLVDDGVLNTEARVAELLPEYTFSDPRFADLTVEHLLIMSSGSPFAEVGSVTSDNWAQDFFASTLSFSPGDGFNYNSMNSYLLSLIVSRISGMSLTELLSERLFKPLHIDSYLWEKNTDGQEKGGWGLYMSCESWARIGIMALCGGVFEGKRIISSKWLDRMTATQNVADGRLGDFNYGYQSWVGADGADFLFNGMFGQNVWVCPKNGVVVSVNCGNNELFQRSPTLGIIRKYLGVDIRDKFTITAQFALRRKQRSFFESRSYVKLDKKPRIYSLLPILKKQKNDPDLEHFVGEYFFPENNVGILPLLVRLMQNNLSSSIKSFKIEQGRDTLIFTIQESDTNHRIVAGIGNYRDGSIEINGEAYLVKAAVGLVRTEADEPLCKLVILFPELPNVRILELWRDGVGLWVRLLEAPDKNVVESFAKTADSAPSGMILTALLKRMLGDAFLSDALDLLFSPTVHAIDMKDEFFDELLKAENARKSSLHSRYKGLWPLVNKFLRDSEPTSWRSPFSVIGSLIKKKRQQEVSENEDEIVRLKGATSIHAKTSEDSIVTNMQEHSPDSTEPEQSVEINDTATVHNVINEKKGNLKLSDCIEEPLKCPEATPEADRSDNK